MHQQMPDSAAFDAEFTVLDVDGASHTYQLTLHGFSDGRRLTFELSAHFSRFAASGLGALLEGDDAMGADLSMVDWTAGGRELSSVLAGEADSDLVDRLLRHVVRDGVPLTVAGAMDRAYRGNYGEMWGALWGVIAHNRFLSLPGMSLDGVLSQMAGTLRAEATSESGETGPQPHEQG